MRLVGYAMVGALALTLGAGSALAGDGGIGTHPPAFLHDILQPVPAKPYHSVCVAPPTACDVDYMYPIHDGKSCWCRSGLFVFTSGVTHLPPRARAYVYK